MFDLARDISDILGARRAISGNAPGVLSWGLPGSITGLSPQVDNDRKQLAEHMRDLLVQFEPRLEDVQVIPVAGAKDFSFQLTGSVVDEEDDSVTLRIITPRRGGGLGAEVAVIGGKDGQTAVIKED